MKTMKQRNKSNYGQQQNQQHYQRQSTTPSTFEGSGVVLYESSQRGNKLLHYLGHKYIKNNDHGKSVYWKCTKWHNGCKARAITNQYNEDFCYTKNVHNHDPPNTSIELFTGN